MGRWHVPGKATAYKRPKSGREKYAGKGRIGEVPERLTEGWAQSGTPS